MDLYRFEDMKGGWFVGDFLPTTFKTAACEVCYKKHPKGDRWDRHYHAVATEINLLVKGRMRIQNTELNEGVVFVVHPNEVADPEFLEDCEVVVVKVPSIKNDKYVC